MPNACRDRIAHQDLSSCARNCCQKNRRGHALLSSFGRSRRSLRSRSPTRYENANLTERRGCLTDLSVSAVSWNDESVFEAYSLIRKDLIRDASVVGFTTVQQRMTRKRSDLLIANPGGIDSPGLVVRDISDFE